MENCPKSANLTPAPNPKSIAKNNTPNKLAKLANRSYSGLPWNKQEWETPLAHLVFQTYLLMGPRRTTENAIREHYPMVEGRKTRPSQIMTNVRNWSVQNHWIRRAEAFDRHQADLIEKAHIDQIKRMNRRHARKYRSAYRHAMDRILTLLQDPEQELDLDTLRKVADTATKWERLATGVIEEQTTKVDVSITNNQWNLDNLTAEEVKALIHIRKKAFSDINPSNPKVITQSP